MDSPKYSHKLTIHKIQNFIKVSVVFDNFDFLDDIDNNNLFFLDLLDQLCASWTLLFGQKDWN